MPEVNIEIGGRVFEVSCQEGEEHYLQSAAKMLDEDAQSLLQQVGRMPEARMLLRAGLMLADKTASVEDQIAEVKGQLAERDAELEGLRNAAGAEPERVEVPVVPAHVTDALAELAARAEAVAGDLEEKAGA